MKAECIVWFAIGLLAGVVFTMAMDGGFSARTDAQGMPCSVSSGCH